MLCIMLTEQNILDYMPQIISLFGTILGTILGWFLHWLSNNVGKAKIFVNDFKDQKSNQNEYACIFKLFINNTSYKEQCIRNARLLFIKYDKDNLFEIELSEGRCDFESIKAQKNKSREMISINSCSQGEYTLSALIDGEKYTKLSEARKISLVYEDSKNHTKKKTIKSGFVLDTVEKSQWKSF